MNITIVSWFLISLHEKVSAFFENVRIKNRMHVMFKKRITKCEIIFMMQYYLQGTDKEQPNDLVFKDGTKLFLFVPSCISFTI